MDDTYNRSALHLAIEDNDYVQVVRLINLGSDIEAPDWFKKTPLHFAAFYNSNESHIKIIELLLKKGANVNARDNYGNKPIYYLVQSANARVLELFLKFKADVRDLDEAGGNLLYPALRHNKNVDLLQLLVDQGLDVDHRDTTGKTPLHRACDYDCLNFKVVKCLLKNGANMNAVDRRGYTPLTELVRSCNASSGVRILKVLNFVLEHTDFREIQNYAPVLTVNYKSYQNYLWKTVLEHLAKLQSVDGPQEHKAFFATVPALPSKCNDYFEKCQQELMLAKTIRLRDSWLTFYSLLVDDRKKLKNYAGNRELIDDFKNSDCAKIFPIYGNMMTDKVNSGIKRRELFDRSAEKLSACLPIFNPTHLIVRDVLDCILSKKDLAKLCK